MSHDTIGKTTPSIAPTQRSATLAAALEQYRATECPEYDETLDDLIGRVAAIGSLGKTDLGALLLWKRIRVGAWAEELLCTPNSVVRKITAAAGQRYGTFRPSCGARVRRREAHLAYCIVSSMAIRFAELPPIRPCFGHDMTTDMGSSLGVPQHM